MDLMDGDWLFWDSIGQLIESGMNMAGPKESTLGGIDPGG